MPAGDGGDGGDREQSGGGERSPVPDGHSFALCLTHDVDRPYKTFQSLYYAATERRPGHLKSLLPGANPYWQFEDLLALEEDLGVRSAFYLLREQHLFRDRPLREWLAPACWKRYFGRYTLSDPAIRDLVRDLDAGGWEVGLHGSFESYDDPDLLREEKAAVEDLLGRPVAGIRQHYLNLDVPDTWEHHADLGLRYDASLGSSTEYGFRYGHGVRRPFGDEFVVFPLTAMELALPDPGESFDAAWRACRMLLDEAAANDAAMTVLWHPRYFHEGEFPGFRRLYRKLIEEALAMDAWVGPPGELYEEMEHPDGEEDAPSETAVGDDERPAADRR